MFVEQSQKERDWRSCSPEIEQRFIEYSSQHYDITKEECAKVIKPFIQVILDASAYAFSWNHSDSTALSDISADTCGTITRLSF